MTKGGPNWAENTVDAPIIIDAAAGEYYKQPMYYALGHVTRHELLFRLSTLTVVRIVIYYKHLGR